MVSLNLGAMKSEPKAPNVGPIKIETGQGTAKSISQPTSRPIMEGSAQKEKADGGITYHLKYEQKYKVLL